MVMGLLRLAIMLSPTRNKRPYVVRRVITQFTTSLLIVSFSANLHRFPDGHIDRAPYGNSSGCTAKFFSFHPDSEDDWRRSPKAVVICANPHTHPEPAPIRTPPAIENVLEGLLTEQGWRIGDCTARRLAVNQGFISGLRQALPNPPVDRDPILADLHPSLANEDHANVLIGKVRDQFYPDGTGFKGMHIIMSLTQTKEY